LNQKKTVMLVFGTRPEAIKMAPLYQELAKREGLRALCCVTAQHREMLDSVLELFAITPDYDLNLMKPGQTLPMITTGVLQGMESVLTQAKPDLILVHGDTSTTFSGALTAFYAQIPVGHVEAGLRTFDRYSPFPEEMNRKLVGSLAELHFCPTGRNRENLARESIADGVFVTGNTVIDALETTVREGYTYETAELALVLNGKKLVLITCHRRENYGQPMENIMSAIGELAVLRPELNFVYPVHLSGVVQEAAHRVLDGIENVYLVPPLPPADMHNLMAESYLIMTDSGGLQEEAPALGKPVLVLRKETERPEAVEAGTVQVVGVEQADIVDAAQRLLTDEAAYAAMAHAVNPYGDGQACRRIGDAIEWYFGLRQEKPEEF